ALLLGHQPIQLPPATGAHFVVTFLSFVHSSTPPAPVMSPWPKREPLLPPNENGSRGTGTPTLIPIMPLSARSAICAAIAPFCVNTLVAFPYGLACSIASAASTLGTRTMLSTGPKS